jgi:Mrp family chromosome partitioning ATPase
VGLDGDQPEGLAEIVNTLVDVYIAVQKSEEIHAVGSRLRTLQQEMDSLGKEMADDQARRTQLAQELGVSTFTENYVNPYGQRLVPEKQALAGEAARKESSGSSFTAKYQDGIRLSQRIEQARKRRETVDESMKFLDLESRGPGFVSVFSEAPSAGLTAKGGRTKLALLFCLAGLVIAFLAPVAIDVAGPRLLVPSDVGRALGFDPLGWVPDRKELGEEFTWDLVMRLAHRIDQERQRHGARIWMFSAVKSGGGTTTLVNSLGRAFVTLGIPALSVEANAYRADGRFASKSAGSGLSGLLRGHSTLSGSIEVGDGEMPDRIPIGELDGTGHLPDIHRLREVLGEAAQSYALVLVDMPPVLASVDSEYFARRADCVVLVAEARRVTAPELKRAAKVLERIQPKSVACVLNRVHAADGGGFGQDAKRDFETEAAKPAPAWQQPLL